MCGQTGTCRHAQLPDSLHRDVTHPDAARREPPSSSSSSSRCPPGSLALGPEIDNGSNAFQICTSSCQAGLPGAGDGQFNGLSGLATDSSGNVYVADWINDRVQKFAGWGAFGTKWGSTGSGPGEFAAPDGVAVDSSGAIYVADSSNQRIEVFCNCTQTTITAGPSGMTNNMSASFSFASSEPGSSFECRLDSNQEADFQPCTSPKSYAALADGSHTFEVRATSPGLGTDPTPASRTFTVDTLPPETTITSGPSGLTSDSTPTFAFSSSETGSTFQCKVDSAPYAACNSPKTTGPLADGSHTFYVRATDPASNTDPTPALRHLHGRCCGSSDDDQQRAERPDQRRNPNLYLLLLGAGIFRVQDRFRLLWSV